MTEPSERARDTALHILRECGVPNQLMTAIAFAAPIIQAALDEARAEGRAAILDKFDELCLREGWNFGGEFAGWIEKRGEVET